MINWIINTLICFKNENRFKQQMNVPLFFLNFPRRTSFSFWILYNREISYKCTRNIENNFIEADNRWQQLGLLACSWPELDLIPEPRWATKWPSLHYPYFYCDIAVVSVKKTNWKKLESYHQNWDIRHPARSQLSREEWVPELLLLYLFLPLSFYKIIAFDISQNSLPRSTLENKKA